jgi:hypothetical protein
MRPLEKHNRKEPAMSLTQLTTRAQLGIDAFEVRVEVHISNGLPAFTVVGLPETAVREARDRVRSAVLPPIYPRRVVASTCRSRWLSLPPPGKSRPMGWLASPVSASWH